MIFQKIEPIYLSSEMSLPLIEEIWRASIDLAHRTLVPRVFDFDGEFRIRAACRAIAEVIRG
jgi:hypothetical protein